MTEAKTSEYTVSDFLKSQSLSVLIELTPKQRHWINYRAAEYGVTPEQYVQILINQMMRVNELYGVTGDRNTMHFNSPGSSQSYSYDHPFI